MEARQQITEMIKAGFPLFYIYTEDEDTVESSLKEIAEERELEVGKWTTNIGMLDEFLTSNFKEGSLNMLINTHFFLEQPDIIQIIKDKTKEWKSKQIYIFFLENDKKIPPEINRNITYLEWTLPDETALGNKLEYTRESVNESTDLDLKVFDEDEKTVLVRAALGLTSQQAEDAFALSIIRERRFNPQIVTEIKAGEYLKTGLMELESPVPIENFCGYENLQEYIFDIKDSFFKESRYGLPPAKGILLVGVPGTGKTLASKSIASIFNLMLLKVDIGKVFSEYVGSSERQMRQLISIAERMAPIVLRIDEIEKQLGGMGSNSGDSGAGSRVLAQLLSWMQDRTASVFTIATANDISSLRPEMLRKGRFDEIFFLDLPNREERVSIFDHHMTKRVKEVNWNLWFNQHKGVVDYTQGWSGAEIEQVVIQTLRYFDKYDYEFDDTVIYIRLEQEVKATVPLSVIRKDDIDKIRNWAVDNNARLASKNIALEQDQENRRRKIMI